MPSLRKDNRSTPIKWVATVRVKGCKQKSKSFINKKAAIDWGYKTEKEFKSGAVQPTDLASLIAAYEKSHPNCRLAVLSFWDKRLPKKPAAIHILEVMNQMREEGYMESTIDYNLRHLNRVYKEAVELNLIDHNPLKDIPKSLWPKVPAPEAKYLSVDEIHDVLFYTKKYPAIHAAVLLALTTGCRVSELMSIEWNDILEDGRILIRNSVKTGRSRTVFLHPLAKIALSVLPRDRDKVFHSYIENYYYKFRPANVKAGWHQFRHTWASLAASNGATLLGIQHGLGHARVVTTARYAWLVDNTEMRKATACAVNAMFPAFPAAGQCKDQGVGEMYEPASLRAADIMKEEESNACIE